jgi:cell pole-organizing protein PopZ
LLPEELNPASPSGVGCVGFGLANFSTLPRTLEPAPGVHPGWRSRKLPVKRSGLRGEQMSDTPTTEQSMDETLKELERQLAEGDQPPGNAPQSAEILNLAEAAGDSRKGRSQNRAKTVPGAEQGSPGAEAANREADQYRPSDGSAAETVTPGEPAIPQRQPLGAMKAARGGAAGTLEGVLCELIRPVLQGWVDQKLGGIVDELVKAEIAKALEQAGVF